MVALLIVVGAVCFWGFKSGDSRSFQIAKNLDIFNSIVKELDMFYVDTIDPNKTIREGIDAMLYSLAVSSARHSSRTALASCSSRRLVIMGNMMLMLP